MCQYMVTLKLFVNIYTHPTLKYCLFLRKENDIK